MMCSYIDEVSAVIMTIDITDCRIEADGSLTIIATKLMFSYEQINAFSGILENLKLDKVIFTLKF